MISAVEAQAASLLVDAEDLLAEHAILVRSGGDTREERAKVLASARQMQAIGQRLRDSFDLLSGPGGRDAAVIQRAIDAIEAARTRLAAAVAL